MVWNGFGLPVNVKWEAVSVHPHFGWFLGGWGGGRLPGLNPGDVWANLGR